MMYGSVCSGIEAATVAWQPLDDKRHLFLSLPHVRYHGYGSGGCSISVSPNAVQEMMVANGWATVIKDADWPTENTVCFNITKHRGFLE